MATVYDWAPFFDSINNATNQWSQRNQYNAMLGQLMGKGTPAPITAQAPQQAPETPASMQTAGGATITARPTPLPSSISTPQIPINGSYGDNAPMSYDGAAGSVLGSSASALLPMLRNAPPSVGLPLLLNLATKNAERQQNIADARVTPMSEDEAKSLGLRPGGKYGRDISGNIVEIQKSDMLSPGAVQQQYDMKRQEGIIAGDAPLTKEQELAHLDRVRQINASLSQPHFVPYGTTSYIQNGKLVNIPGAGGTASTFGEGDPNSPTVNGQLGISTNAYNMLTGNNAAVARGRPQDMAAHELDAMIQRRGLDPSIVRPRVQAYGDAVKMNTLKSNTMDTLTSELSGTIQNIMPVADKLGGNDIRWTKQGAEIVGRLANDPNAQQYAFYLTQLRSELAGFNAVSAGKIGLHGQVEVNESHIAEAEKVIRDGLSSGGAKGLGAAVDASRAKNVAVVEHQTEEAQRGIWNALGIGANYDRLHGKGGGAPAPALPAAAKSQLKENVVTTFGNGQKWTLKNGQAVKVN